MYVAGTTRTLKWVLYYNEVPLGITKYSLRHTTPDGNVIFQDYSELANFTVVNPTAPSAGVPATDNKGSVTFDWIISSGDTDLGLHTWTLMVGTTRELSYEVGSIYGVVLSNDSVITRNLASGPNAVALPLQTWKEPQGWNPIDNGGPLNESLVFSVDSLVCTMPDLAWVGVGRGLNGPLTSGKWYWEVKYFEGIGEPLNLPFYFGCVGNPASYTLSRPGLVGDDHFSDTTDGPAVSIEVASFLRFWTSTDLTVPPANDQPILTGAPVYPSEFWIGIHFDIDNDEWYVYFKNARDSTETLWGPHGLGGHKQWYPAFGARAPTAKGVFTINTGLSPFARSIPTGFTPLRDY